MGLEVYDRAIESTAEEFEKALIEVLTEADDSDEAFHNYVFPDFDSRPRLTIEEYRKRKEAGEELVGYIIYHPKEMAKAILENRGYVSRTARAMGVSVDTVRKAVKDYEICEIAMNTARERRTDRVESKMLDRIDEGSDRLIEFYMRTQARDRGYGDVRRIEGVVAGSVQIEYVNNWRGSVIEGEYTTDDPELLEDGD